MMCIKIPLNTIPVFLSTYWESLKCEIPQGSIQRFFMSLAPRSHPGLQNLRSLQPLEILSVSSRCLHIKK